MTGPGAGDIAHVYLLELGPNIAHEDVEYITYDDATLQLLVVKGGHVFAYDVSKGPAGDSSLKWMYPLQVSGMLLGGQETSVLVRGHVSLWTSTHASCVCHATANELCTAAGT